MFLTFYCPKPSFFSQLRISTVMNRLIGFASIGAIGSLLLAGNPAQASCLVNSTSGPLNQYAGRAIDILNSPLSSADLRSAGDCLLTRDAKTGLEWLDLTATFGQTYRSIASGNGGYTTTDGFRFATEAEVRTLFQNAVVQARVTNEPSAIDRPVPVGTIGEISLLTAALGSTVTSNSATAITFSAYGVYGTPRDNIAPPVSPRPIYLNDQTISLANYFLAQSFVSPVSPFQTATNESLGGSINTQDSVVRDLSGRETPVGAFLVRSSPVQSVPTPSMLPGVLGLIAMMRKRLKHEG
jgi:hypothetical protein